MRSDAGGARSSHADRFAELLDRLVLTPSRNGKLKLLVDYFRAVEDPDRGLALAAITGDLSIAAVKPAMLRALVAERMDPVLFGYSYDYVGDLAETVSLVWPDPPPHSSPTTSRRSARSSAKLQAASRSDGPNVLARLLDSAGIEARFAIIKLVTGGLRIGVSARLAKQALADFGKVDVTEIEELWHGLTPPYAELFAWLEGKADKPEKTAKALFRPVMLSNPVEDGDLEKLDPADYAAEWKWDGIRVQAVSEGGIRRLYSRTGDDVSRRLSRPRRRDEFFRRARRRAAGRRSAERDRHVFRPAAAAEPQDGVAEDPRAVSGLHALLRPIAARRRGSARPALRRAARASRSLRRDARPDALRPVAAGALRRLGSARRDAQEPAASGDRRRDAEAAAIRPISPGGRKARGSSGSAIRTRSTRC